MLFGRRNTGGRKLTSEQVWELRQRYEAGETQGALAKAFGISAGQAGRIVRGESWGGSAATPRGELPKARVEDTLELSAARMFAKQERGLSPLDGGEMPEDGTGEGISALQQKAAEILKNAG